MIIGANNDGGKLICDVVQVAYVNAFPCLQKRIGGLAKNVYAITFDLTGTYVLVAHCGLVSVAYQILLI